MTLQTTDQVLDYQAAHTGAVFSLRPNAGYLRITGEDRVSFLNRQTSNDVFDLTEQQTSTTVLTSPTARIEDVLLLVDEGGSIGAVSLPSRQALTARRLQGKIFFMDKVTVIDASTEYAQIELFGPTAGTILSTLKIEEAPAPTKMVSAIAGEAQVRVIGTAQWWNSGYLVLLPVAEVDAVLNLLVGGGALPLSAETYEILRIEAGVPAAESELTEAYNPLEAGLQAAISESKGCYTGQEIIARQITYDKVTRRLVGLTGAQKLQVGCTVMSEDKRVGLVTSTAISPRLGPIALAYVKRPSDIPGTQVTILDDDSTVAALVSSLPFV